MISLNFKDQEVETFSQYHKIMNSYLLLRNIIIKNNWKILFDSYDLELAMEDLKQHLQQSYVEENPFFMKQALELNKWIEIIIEDETEINSDLFENLLINFQKQVVLIKLDDVNVKNIIVQKMIITEIKNNFIIKLILKKIMPLARTILENKMLLTTKVKAFYWYQFNHPTKLKIEAEIKNKDENLNQLIDLNKKIYFEMNQPNNQFKNGLYQIQSLFLNYDELQITEIDTKIIQIETLFKNILQLKEETNNNITVNKPLLNDVFTITKNVMNNFEEEVSQSESQTKDYKSDSTKYVTKI